MKIPIALVITDKETNAQIKPLKVDVLELRVDLFKKLTPEYVTAQIKHRRVLGIPLLLTVRNQKKEGAFKECSDALKKSVLETCLPLVDMVDIELSSPLLKSTVSLARRLGKKVIVSAHHLDHTPGHMENILKKALSAGANIVKIAAHANSFDDVLRMIEFTRHHRRHHVITMSLGPIGAISRLVLPGAGSLYTYTFINKSTAPGQIEVKSLKAHLKFFYP